MTDKKLDEAADKSVRRGNFIEEYGRSECLDAFKAGAEFERNRILELLRSKTAMGWELDHAFRSGDLSIVSDWLESQLSDKSD